MTSRLVILLVLSLFAGFLAVNSYQHWKYLTLTATEQASGEAQKLTIFRDVQAEQLARDAVELQRELTFNQWPDEQRILVRRLLENTQSRINRRPFNGLLWLELVNIQQQQRGIQHPDYSWSFKQAIRLNGWQKKAFAPLAHHCIHQEEQLDEEVLAECKRLLSQPFAARLLGNHAKILGLDKHQIKEILKQVRGSL